MTELVVRLRKKELDYLKRNREHVFAEPADGAYIGQLVRSRFLWALEVLERNMEARTTPAESEYGDPYADEPDEDA